MGCYLMRIGTSLINVYDAVFLEFDSIEARDMAVKQMTNRVDILAYTSTPLRVALMFDARVPNRAGFLQSVLVSVDPQYSDTDIFRQFVEPVRRVLW